MATLSPVQNIYYSFFDFYLQSLDTMQLIGSVFDCWCDVYQKEFGLIQGNYLDFKIRVAFTEFLEKNYSDNTYRYHYHSNNTEFLTGEVLCGERLHETFLNKSSYGIEEETAEVKDNQSEETEILPSEEFSLAHFDYELSKLSNFEASSFGELFTPENVEKYRVLWFKRRYLS